MSQLCNFCKEEINETKFVSTDKEMFYHINHFRCCDCGIQQSFNKPIKFKETNLSELPYYEKDKKLYCLNDFHKHFSPTCYFCKELIKEQYISAMGFSFHKDHFKCAECEMYLSSKTPIFNRKFMFIAKFYRKDEKYYCENCYSATKAKICHLCEQPILDNIINALNKHWHSSCFLCHSCKESINNQSFTTNNERLFHVNCYKEEFFEKCFLCGKYCENEYYQADGKVGIYFFSFDF